MATPVVWTNDDLQPGLAPQLRCMVDFLRPLGIRGVFFVIPKGNGSTIADDAELLRAIDAARAEGHEFYQHGYVHTPFESGVPETWMLDVVPEVRRQYDDRRVEIEDTHTLEALTAMLENGRRIWRRAFGEDSPGYRPGWGAFCNNLYTAAAMLGFDWISSRIPSRTCWLRICGQWDEPIEFRESVPAAPYEVRPGLIEFPIAGEYANRVPDQPDRIDSMVDLGMAEFAWWHSHRLPMLILSHWHGLECNGDLNSIRHVGIDGTGFAVHRKLLPKLIDSGKARFITMSELHAEVAPAAAVA